MACEENDHNFIVVSTRKEGSFTDVYMICTKCGEPKEKSFC
jgi:hypothetical protein